MIVLTLPEIDSQITITKEAKASVFPEEVLMNHPQSDAFSDRTEAQFLAGTQCGSRTNVSYVELPNT